ncbi:MAG: tetratricopeptide repeat protein [Bacteroidota bacterium]
MKPVVLYFFLFLLYLTSASSAQSGKADSLRKVLPALKSDTNMVRALSQLAWELGNTNPDTAILLDKQALELAARLASADQKLAPFTGSITGRIKSQLGVYYWMKGEYATALSYQFEALKIREDSGDKKGVSVSLGNIANVFHDRGEYDKALEYHFRGLKIAEELGDKKSLSIKYGNIGNAYKSKGDADKALEYYLKALKLAEEVNDRWGISRHYGNLGVIYKGKGDYQTALSYFLKSLEIKKELKDNIGIAIRLNNIGGLYATMGDVKQAERYMLQSLSLCDSIGALDDARLACQSLYVLYEGSGRYGLALKYYKRFVEASDSISSKENIKRQTQIEMNYEFEKQQVADSIRNMERMKQEELRHNQEIQQQRIYTIGGIIGFLLMLVVAVISFRAYQAKQRANEIISEQKLLVEEKQKEILDSIHYARRIQSSLLPSEKYMDKALKRLSKY